VTLDVALRTDPGQERERNEDAGHIEELGGGAWLFVVCDGMGGHDDGDVASHTAIGHIVDHVVRHVDADAPYAVLHEALVGAHKAVTRVAAGSNMGTTAVVGWVRGDRCWYGWVGDSRLYHLRGHEVVERSEDHTRVAMLVASGEITEAEAADHPDASVLVQALGAGMLDVRPTVYREPIQLRDGDALVLCSDGLHDLVRDHELPGEILGDAGTTASSLVDLANARGGHDNITVVVAQMGANPPASRDTSPDLGSPKAPRPATVSPATASAPPPAPEATAQPVWTWVLVFLAGVLVGVALREAALRLVDTTPQATPEAPNNSDPPTPTPANPHAAPEPATPTPAPGAP
jgi:protein phosphatase